MPPTDLEQEILIEVVNRYLKSWEPTERKVLVRKFQAPAVVDGLYRIGLIKTVDNTNNPAYFPGALAFHYCGDAQAEDAAKSSVQLIARILKKQYLEDAIELSIGNLQSEVRRLDGTADAETTVRLGLYLGPDFGLLQGWTGGTRQEPEIRPSAIAETVVTLKTETLWDDYIAQNVPWPKQDSSGGIIHPTGVYDPRMRESIELLDAEAVTTPMPISRRIFVVHGHDQGTKEAVALFLEGLHLEPVILHKQANKGRTLIEKFEGHSDVGFAVVLLTPDDVGRSATDGYEFRKRARQNVVLELGYFMGKLGRPRVCALYIEGVELPSDINGVLYIPYGQDGAWRVELAREIRAAGIEVESDLLP